MRTGKEIEDDLDSRDAQPEAWWIDVVVVCAVALVFIMVALSWWCATSLVTRS